MQDQRFSGEPKSVGWAVLWSCLILILTYRLNGTAFTTGLDPGYVSAFNYFAQHRDLVLGRDVIFSYGPIGFLLFPQPLANHLELSALFWLLVGFLALTAGAQLTLRNKAHARPSERFAGLFALFVIANFCFGSPQLTGYLPVFAIILHLLAYPSGHGAVHLTAAALFFTVAFLTKPMFGIVAGGSVFSFVLYQLLVKRDWRPALTLSALALSFTLAFWLAWHRTLEGFLSFLWATLQLSIGNSSAMTLNPDNHWLLLAGSALAFALYLRFAHQAGCRLLPWLMPLPLFFMFKYGFARIDNHIWFTLLFLIGTVALGLLAVSRVSWKLALSGVLSIALFALNAGLLETTNPWTLARLSYALVPQGEIPSHWLRMGLERLLGDLPQDGPVGYLLEVTARPSTAMEGGFSGYRDRLREQSQNGMQAAAISPAIRERIGTASVDAYPWDTAYLFANSLRWVPRPVIQSYISYTPMLDQRNTDFFFSEGAPEYLLWERKHATKSIDGRHLFNDEPRTIMAILDRYRLLAAGPKVALWQRTERRRFAAPIALGNQDATWEQWIDLPPHGTGILRAEVQAQRSLRGLLMRRAYKEGEIWIDYRLFDGREKRYRLVPDHLASGVWVDPLVEDLAPDLAGNRVRQVRFHASEFTGYQPALRVQWLLYPFAVSDSVEPGE